MIFKKLFNKIFRRKKKEEEIKDNISEEIGYALKSIEYVPDIDLIRILLECGYMPSTETLKKLRKICPVVHLNIDKDKNLSDDENIIMIFNITKKEGNDALDGINAYLRRI